MTNTIGIDLDNTIVSYDRILHEHAVSQGYFDPNMKAGKMQIRDHVRNLDNGEIKWQILQASIYGPKMKDADLIDGVVEFLFRCKNYDYEVFIVSHKTTFAHYDTTNTNLRQSAMEWLEKKGFFKKDALGVDPNNVYFESSRQKKINRIISLNCEAFIDDLEETFLEKSFPEVVSKILFDPYRQYIKREGTTICRSWKHIMEQIFEG